jgi:hypothetical protein
MHLLFHRENCFFIAWSHFTTWKISGRSSASYDVKHFPMTCIIFVSTGLLEDDRYRSSIDRGQLAVGNHGVSLVQVIFPIRIHTSQQRENHFLPWKTRPPDCLDLPSIFPCALRLHGFPPRQIMKVETERVGTACKIPVHATATSNRVSRVRYVALGTHRNYLIDLISLEDILQPHFI